MSFPNAVLLDRDGTIIREREYLSDPAGVELLPNALAGLRRMQEAGSRLFVLTNQSGVGRGYFTLDDVARIHERIQQLLAVEGIMITEFLVCPHGPDDGCSCRKPRNGLALAAAATGQFALENAVVVGDKLTDLEMGHAVGATSVLVRTGYGRQHEAAAIAQGDVVVDDLLAAAEWMEFALNAD